jgi:hypothetical protein
MNSDGDFATVTWRKKVEGGVDAGLSYLKELVVVDLQSLDCVP